MKNTCTLSHKVLYMNQQSESRLQSREEKQKIDISEDSLLPDYYSCIKVSWSLATTLHFEQFRQPWTWP